MKKQTLTHSAAVIALNELLLRVFFIPAVLTYALNALTDPPSFLFFFQKHRINNLNSKPIVLLLVHFNTA